MSDFKGEKYGPELRKRNTWLDTIEDVTIDDAFIYVAKSINDDKNKARNEYDMRKNGKLRDSNKHAEELNEDDLFVGMLGEAVVACKYGVGKSWLEEQKKQIEKIKKYGSFDITDVGRVQVRTGFYIGRLVSIIVRPGDFSSKAGQPIVGCVYYAQKQTMKICGWTTLDEIKSRDTQYGNYGGDGTYAFWVAPYDLNPMSTFDTSFLQ